MIRKTILSALVGVVVASAFGVAAAAAAPTQLVLPQSTAFAVLHASCGGIQEQVSATGFDARSGYPTGDVHLSTRCGGSGRGGGYHSTTYSASVAATWDFTGALISYGPVTTPPTGPTFTAFDANGNKVYNQASSAYLLLAPGFVPAPRVTAISVASGPAAGGTSVTIYGTGFAGVTRVSFGATAASSFTVNGSTSITAVSPAASGTVDVTITNAGGTSASTAQDRFTFVPVPSVSSVSPQNGPVGGGTEVTIAGAGLTGATQVSFGGTPASFWVNNDNSITAISPAAEAAESVHVRVTSLGGRSATGTNDRFTYLVTTPVVTGIDPSSGPAGGGTLVTISGSSFTGATQVSFGGIPAVFSVYSDTTIAAVSPVGAAGTVDVTVANEGGTSAPSAGDQFTFVAAPTVSAVDPNTGPVAGGTTVTVTGTGFANAVEVDFGGVPAAFVVNNDTSITATSPAAAAAGTVDVTVISSDGGTSAASAADQFTFVAAPTVSAVDPNVGSVGGGNTVTVTGTGFANAVEVDFGGVPAAFVVNGDTSITATSPAAAAAGTVDVTVITSDGGTSAANAGDQFTYQ